MSKTPELIPCPAGHTEASVEYETYELGFGGCEDIGPYWVECSVCHWRGPEKRTEKSAIKAWNKSRIL